MNQQKKQPLISVIIPLASGELAWKSLLRDLAVLPVGCEVVFVTADKGIELNFFSDLQQGFLQHLIFRIIDTEAGRGQQLNAGAETACGEWLWFLHADSRFSVESFQSLLQTMKISSSALIYFNLNFLSDGPVFMGLNARGVWLRSHLLGIPFGDQGFCLRKQIFEQIGLFPVGASYGEDHLFVWKARQKNIKLRCTGSVILTSARKYCQKGWGRTTLMHLWLTARQALPQFLKTIS